MISSGEIEAGLLVLLFFGVGGAYAIPKALRRKVTMVLSPEGIELTYAEGVAIVPWPDIERIGVVIVGPKLAGTKMVGIRLKSYDGFLNEMSPELAAFSLKGLSYLKLAAKAATSVDAPGGVGLWVKAAGEPLESFGDVGSLAQALKWTRDNYGYDLAFAWSELDRPPDQFVRLLEEYQQTV